MVRVLASATIYVLETNTAAGRNHKRYHNQKRQEVDVVTEVTTAATVYVNQGGQTVAPGQQGDTVIVTVEAPPVIVMTTVDVAAPVVYTTVEGAPAPASPAPAAPTPVAPAPVAPAPQPSSSVPIAVEAAPSSQKAAAAPATTYKEAPRPPPTTSAAPPPPPTTSAAPPPPPTTSAAPATHSSSSSASAPASSSSSSSGSGPQPKPKSGIVYSPYNADRSCKTTAQVAADLAKLKDYSPIRIYGTDCNQVANVYAAAKAQKQQLFVGIYDVHNPDSELKYITDAVDDWRYIHTVSMGNEVVNSGTLSAPAYAEVINNGRTTLRAKGYTGPVVGVDTFVAIMANPIIAQASDYIAANCHPFFDGGVVAAKSGDFLTEMKKQIAAKCGGTSKKIMITGKRGTDRSTSPRLRC